MEMEPEPAPNSFQPLFPNNFAYFIDWQLNNSITKHLLF